MAPEFARTRALLAENCRRLKELANASDMALGKRSRIAPKTVNNLINEATNPTLKSIVAMAAAHGVEPWQLLHPDFKDAVPSITSMEQMARALESLSDQDFAAVLRARSRAD